MYHKIEILVLHCSKLLKMVGVFGLLLLVATKAVASSVVMEIKCQPSNVYGQWSTWTFNDYDSGSIWAVIHVAPGTPAGNYSVVLRDGSSFTVTVDENGSAPSTQLWSNFDRAYYFPEGLAKKLETTYGTRATVYKRTKYYGNLGAPYTGTIPPGQNKIALLDVYIPAESAPPQPPTLPGDGNDKPNDPGSGGNGADGGDENNQVVGGDDHGCTHGMARYTANLATASLRITDTPLEYTPPVGAKIDFIASYNQLDSDQSVTQAYSNLGPNWTFNWISYVTDDPTAPSADVQVYVRGGGKENYSGFQFGFAGEGNLTEDSSLPDAQSHAVLTRTSRTRYEKRFPDGSKLVYSRADGSSTYPRLIFMTQVVDQFGNTVNIDYLPDGTNRIDTITDALGVRKTQFWYENTDPLKVTKVTDPFGRSAVLSYEGGKLKNITDPELIKSEFHYAPNTNFIDQLTTPYGVTKFETGASGGNRWLNMVDGNVTDSRVLERVEYREQTSAISPQDPSGKPEGAFVNDSLDRWNSFYWSKQSISMFPPVAEVYDYGKAEVTHWLLSSDGTTSSSIASSEKKQLENRVWYTYLGQPDYKTAAATGQPDLIARLVSGGTQASHFEYNALGNVTKTIDPVGRTFTNGYAANGIDLLEKRQTRNSNNELLQSFTYNPPAPPHLPDSATDAAGQVTHFTYTTKGQLLSLTNAKNEITTNSYGPVPGVPAGYLASVTGPAVNSPAVSSVTSFTYDGANRPQTVTTTDTATSSYSIFREYDNLDRLKKITYPDATFQQFVYTDNITGLMTLDVTQSRDRMGRWTFKHYNSNKELDKATDAEGGTTGYNWCKCGSLESITDPNNHVTTFLRDVEGRVYQKTFADETFMTYLYEGQAASGQSGMSGRLHSVTDTLNQTATYAYFLDDSTQQASYSNAQHLTPTVLYTYDPDYKRIATLTVGNDLTTYHYNAISNSPALGAGKLQWEDGPLANDTISYVYDELGREKSYSVNGVLNEVVFDAAGRIANATNPLGFFSYAYDGASARMLSATYPNAQTATYGYYPNTGDFRLQSIWNRNANGATLSQDGYVYSIDGTISSWTKLLGSNAVTYGYSYDETQRLVSVTNNLSPQKEYDFDYDQAGNRTFDRAFNPQSQMIPNGTSHEYNYSEANVMTDVTTITSGPQTTAVGSDGNGSMSSFSGKLFEWDAANRLSAVTSTVDGGRSDFAYDGMGRRMRITESGPGIQETVQPSGNAYTAFSSAVVTLPAGSYTLTFAGATSATEGDVALLDSVTMNDVLVSNGGFESPLVSGDQTAPANATWTFQGTAGLSGSGSTFTSGSPSAPDGAQVAFIRGDGAVLQVFNLAGGAYVLNFRLAQRASGNANLQKVNVTLRKTVQGATAVKNLVWKGNSIAEERDANNAVKKRYFAQGEQRYVLRSETLSPYYYTRDHLGSVREVTDSSGAVLARYDYDAWGNKVVLSGTLSLDFGYAGYYYHAPSGLNLTLNRAYNPFIGRWLSRDPIGETGGLNLYGYVENNPLNEIDPLGLQAVEPYNSSGHGLVIESTAAYYGVVGGTGGSAVLLMDNGVVSTYTIAGGGVGLGGKAGAAQIGDAYGVYHPSDYAGPFINVSANVGAGYSISSWWNGAAAQTLGIAPGAGISGSLLWYKLTGFWQTDITPEEFAKLFEKNCP